MYGERAFPFRKASPRHCTPSGTIVRVLMGAAPCRSLILSSSRLFTDAPVGQEAFLFSQTICSWSILVFLVSLELLRVRGCQGLGAHKSKRTGSMW